MIESKDLWIEPDNTPPIDINPDIVDYLRRIAEALEAYVNLMTPSKTEVPPFRVYNGEVDIPGIGGVILTPHEAGDDK